MSGTELLYLDAAKVAELLRGVDPLEVAAETLRAVHEGTAGITPEAALRWTASDGTAARSLILPAHHTGRYGAKIINACVGNIDRGLPRANGLIILFDPDTAVPTCVMEGAQVSALRTAAVSIAGLRAVRPLDGVRHVSFLGAGRQSATHLDLLAAHSPLETVTVFDAVPERASRFADEHPDLKVVVAATAGEAVSTSPLTIAATTTTTAYVEDGWLQPGATFINVSLDDATEDLLLNADHLFVDDWPLVSEDTTRLLGRLAHAGRVTGPDEQAPAGGRKVDADFATLLAGGYTRPIAPDDRVVLNPFGMGVHDVALASRVYESAVADPTVTRLPR